MGGVSFAENSTHLVNYDYRYPEYICVGLKHGCDVLILIQRHCDDYLKIFSLKIFIKITKATCGKIDSKCWQKYGCRKIDVC